MLVICCQDIIIEIPLKKQSVIPILRKLKWKNLKGTVTGYGEKTGAISRKTLVVELDRKTNKLLKREEKRRRREYAKEEKARKLTWDKVNRYFMASGILMIISLIFHLLSKIL